jgi:signal transduction histidine kinase
LERCVTGSWWQTPRAPGLCSPIPPPGGCSGEQPAIFPGLSLLDLLSDRFREPLRAELQRAAQDPAEPIEVALADSHGSERTLDMETPFQLELSSVDLVPLLNGLVAAARPLHPRHEVELVAELASLIGTWDGPRLERVVANLLENAIKYSPHGGPVTIGLDRDGDWAVVTVRDDGLGIPSSELARIFGRFERGTNVRDKKIAGSGLGLSDARHVVELHGSAISVESQEGFGSAFTVRLPLHSAS